MRRLLLLLTLATACGGGPEDNLRGRWIAAGDWQRTSEQRITFLVDTYERDGFCAERGRWRLEASQDEWGGAGRDVVLVPDAASVCEGHRLLWHDDHQLWLRPQPFLPFWRDPATP
jgi:hypothetical protein